MKRIPLKGGFEYDAITRWRHLYKYTCRPGVKKSARKKYNKRFRRASKAYAISGLT